MLLHVQDVNTYCDACYQEIDKRSDSITGLIWYVTMRLGKLRALEKINPHDQLRDQIEKVKARFRVKVEHCFGCSSAR
jgi:hypothetical protein